MSKIKIPKIIRNFSLLHGFMPIILCGFDQFLDNKGKLYIRLLVRLVDKSFDEYEIARKYLLQELRTNDKLSYRFMIINHLENCINALNRVVLVFKVSKGKSLGIYISEITKKKIKKLNVSDIRNSIEHIENDINKENYKKGLFLDVDEDYEKIYINENFISFKDLSCMIKQYHFLVLEIFDNLNGHRK